MSLAASFLATLERDPGREFLEGDGGSHRRGELAALARRVAAALGEAGVAPGDRVALSLRKSGWLVAAHVGALAAGAVVVPLNPAYPDAALADQLRRAGVRHGLVDPELAARAVAFAPDVAWSCAEEGGPPQAARLRPEGPRAERIASRAPDAPALLVFTSGTTGVPKGVPLSHANLASNLDTLARVWAWSEADRLLHVLPVFHLHGLGVALYGSLRVGSAVIFHERFDPARVLAEAARERASLLMAVPTMLHRLLREAPGGSAALAGLRAVISGSAPLSPALFEGFRRAFGHAPVERYGMSETGMIASNPMSGVRRPGSVGPPLPGVEIRLHDPETGAEVPHGPGEVWVRGPNVFAGYWEDPAATAAVFRDGWFRTGDLGRLDADGYLHLTGRAKELIVTGGYNVSPLAVEQALGADADPRLLELAAAGVPDVDLGERVTVFAVPAGGVDWQALVAALRRRAEESLPRYAWPREYRRVASLPRNALGKLQRADLSAAQAAAPSADGDS